MHKQRIILIALSTLAMAATFLPWTPAPGPKERWITFSLFFTVIVICLGGNHGEFLKGKFSAGIIACAGLSAVMTGTFLLRYTWFWTSSLLLSGQGATFVAALLIILASLFLKEGTPAEEQ